MSLRLTAFFLCVACVIAGAAEIRAAEPPPTIYASLPWLVGVTRFIAGTTADIQEASQWNASGALRIPKKLPRGARVVALDPIDASRFGMARGETGLYLLYENLPIEEHERGALPFNPSVLPFLSQRIVKVLCEIKPENYSFYQRRLAEFQSRLESTVEVGRSLIGTISVLDLSGSVSPWIRAACGHAVRPPSELWDAWTGDTRTADLTLAVKEAESRNWWIITDPWTPPQIKTRISASPKLISVTLPQAEQDFFDYLHAIYLEIWTAAETP
ncbi:MAG: hypothetical protein LBE65_06860 [Synergistaceae bacterium]|jgi:hypothetical protein|nr:hypothetical protein [Synergistaceae bacterium]